MFSARWSESHGKYWDREVVAILFPVNWSGFLLSSPAGWHLRIAAQCGIVIIVWKRGPLFDSNALLTSVGWWSRHCDYVLVHCGTMDYTLLYMIYIYMTWLYRIHTEYQTEDSHDIWPLAFRTAEKCLRRLRVEWRCWRNCKKKR